MNRVEAIYEHGVLRPLSPLHLKEDQHVDVMVVPPKRPRKVLTWDEVAAHLDEMRQRVGTLPDSTPLIAEDRMRDI